MRLLGTLSAKITIILMTIRWKRIGPILTVITLGALWPLIHELFQPGYMSGIACVRPYPDGRVENDYGKSCYDPELPPAIVLKAKD